MPIGHNDVFKNVAGCVVVVDRNRSRFIFNPNDVIQIIENTNMGLFSFSTPGQTVEGDVRTSTIFTPDHMFVIDLCLDDVVAQIRKQLTDKKVDESINVQ